MRIAVVFPSGHLTSTPCITSLAILLARNGVRVDIYAGENKTTTPKDSYSMLDGVENLKLHIYPVELKSFWENIPLMILGFFPWWISKSWGKKYDFVIAAGVRALFIVGACSIFTRCRYIYLSLELYIRKEKSSAAGKIFKYFEGLFNRKAALSIIQDEQRARILQRENGIESDNILIFPNSPLGCDDTSKSGLGPNALDKYGLNGKKVVIYAGSIFARWAMTDKLVREAINWPDCWALLVHSRARLSDLKRFMPNQAQAANDKVVFSTEPLSHEKYQEMVKESHVGIALFDGRFSENMHYLGYSSGKVSQYLKCGKPIIVTKLPLLSELIEEYECGFSINEICEITSALEKIFDRYDYYSQRARTTFEEVLNPELYLEPLMNRLSIKRQLQSGD